MLMPDCVKLSTNIRTRTVRIGVTQAFRQRQLERLTLTTLPRTSATIQFLTRSARRPPVAFDTGGHDVDRQGLTEVDNDNDTFE